MHRFSILILMMIVFTTSCQKEKKEKDQISIGTKKEKVTPFDMGKTIFNGKGKCYTCHKTDKKSIGPSVIDIVEIYHEENGDLIAFMKQEAEPIVDPNTYTVMKTNFAIIKTFTEEELKAVETYMIEVGKGKK